MAIPVVEATNGFGLPVTEVEGDVIGALEIELAQNGYGTPVAFVSGDAIGALPVRGGANRILLSGRAAAEDIALGGSIGTLSIGDPSGNWLDSITYTLTDAAGDRFAIDGDALERGATALNYEAARAHQITVQADNGTDDPISWTFTIRVTDVNDAPTVANTVPDQDATQDEEFLFQFAWDTFADEDAAVLTYSATLVSDDPLPAWLTFTAETRTFSGTPEIDDVGTISVKVTASDGALSVSDTFDIVVAEAGP